MLILAVVELLLHAIGFSCQPLTHPGGFGTHFEATNVDHYVQDPTRFWIPKPDSIMQAEWVGDRGAHINALGFRGSMPIVPKPAGTIRILCLGDSGTFGWAMNDDETYPAFLETELNRWAQERGRMVRFDVVNAGVNGYTTFQSVEQYKILEDQLDPDIVTIAAGRNDLTPVPMSDASRPVIKPWQSHFMRLISGLRTGQFLIWLSQRDILSRLAVPAGPENQPAIRVTDDEFITLWTFMDEHCRLKNRRLVYIHRAGRLHLIMNALPDSSITIIDFKRLRSIGQIREFEEFGGHPDVPVYRLIAEEIRIQMEIRGILEHMNASE